jgi:UDP-N-acetylglucosamine 2-epimerase (non-hydrolysing)
LNRRLVHLIAAARPNFMKVAPLYHELARASWCEARIVHTGQHYDESMSDPFFRDLQLPAPARHLGVGSGTHAEQTGRTMIAYEAVCQSEQSAAVVVVGDVNATAVCALVETKLWIPVVHLEAGLRSGDRRMPEEINRLVTDAISDLLWTPSPDADANLRAEGVAPERIERVGNIMIDSFEMLRDRIAKCDMAQRLGLTERRYAVVTLHRPSNVDEAGKLATLVSMLEEVAARLQIVFAVHPRTRKRLQEFGLSERIEKNSRILATEPLDYIEFMNLVMGCAIAITDSGGVQEETTYLGIPCVTLRENTERPITLTEGTNRLLEPDEVPRAVDEVLAARWPKGRRPQNWDGHTAQRAATSLGRFLAAL